MNAAPSYPLRALGIGEIFDRAVTIYVRNFVVFTLMVLTLVAPYAVAEYFVVPQSAAASMITDAIAHPGAPAKTAPVLPAFWGGIVVLATLFLLASPLIACAVAFGVGLAYRGEPPDYRVCFGAVFRRWPVILGTTLVQGLILLGTYIAALFVLIIGLFGGVVAIRPALPLAILLFVLTALIMIGVLLLFLVLVMNSIFSMYAATLEQLGVGGAIVTSFRRIFNRREFGKAMLMGLAYLALQIGVLSISGTVGLVFLLVLKSYALELGVSAVLSSLLTAFLSIIVAVYYYDVRTRAEGLDLEVELQRLTS